MNPGHFYAAPAAAPPSHWQPMLPANPRPSSTFWGAKNVQDQLRDLQETLALAKAMQRELELLMKMKDTEGSVEDGKRESTDPYACGFAKYLEGRRLDLETQESLSVEATSYLMAKLRAQMEPFKFVVDETIPWEEKSAASKLSNKRLKSKRNKFWRKKKRKLGAEMRATEHEQFEQADREADEWRAREVAKDIAQVKMEKMKEIAKLKAKEERKKLESELELVLIVEKLQELRSVRIKKLKKQGHFLPEEDDKFLERVRAAVEEEERQALAAVVTDAARDAIATAEESRKAIQSGAPVTKNSSGETDGTSESKPQMVDGKDNIGSDAVHNHPSDGKGSVGPSSGGAYDSVANLPMEFYHYYHGSNNDMGTLIEVRRIWDAYIRAGGSRIPGHWVQPPHPADEVWASYLVRSE